MSKPESKSTSFWSSIPGFITGLAGILTGIVGIVTVLIQLDVIGGGGSGDSADPADPDQPAATATDARRSTRSGGAAQAGQSPPQFTVTPTAVSFGALLNEAKNVTVSNTGSSSLTVDEVTLGGPAASQFAINAQECTGDDVPARGSCTIRVTYEPSSRGDHSASLRVEVAGASSPQQVSLSGSRPL